MSRKIFIRKLLIPLLVLSFAAAGWAVGKRLAGLHDEAPFFGLVLGTLVGLFWGAIFFLVGKSREL